MAGIDALEWVEEVDGGLVVKVPGQYNLGGIEIAQMFELSLQAEGIQATASFNEGTPEGELMLIDMGPINGWDSVDQLCFMQSLLADAGPIIPATPDQHEPPPPISGTGDLSFGKQWLCDEDLFFGKQRLCDEDLFFGKKRFCDEDLSFGKKRLCDEDLSFGKKRVCDEFGKQLFCDEELSYGEERSHPEWQGAGEEANQEEEEGKEEEEEGVGNGAAVASAKRRRRI